MVAKFRKTASLTRRIRNEFKKDVRELKLECEQMNYKLMTFDEAADDDICILSEDEYEIGFSKSIVKLNLPQERYFLTLEDYYKKTELS